VVDVGSGNEGLVREPLRPEMAPDLRGFRRLKVLQKEQARRLCHSLSSHKPAQRCDLTADKEHVQCLQPALTKH